jgi:hypothetical protein
MTMWMLIEPGKLPEYQHCWNVLGCGSEKVVTLHAGQNHTSKTANRSFENVAKFKHLRTVTNQNLINEEIKRLSSKKVKIKMNKTVILPIVLHGCETC